MLDITDMFSKNICHKTIMSRVCSKYCNNITGKCIVERGNSACLKLYTLQLSVTWQQQPQQHKVVDPVGKLLMSGCCNTAYQVNETRFREGSAFTHLISQLSVIIWVASDALWLGVCFLFLTDTGAGYRFREFLNLIQAITPQHFIFK